LEHNVPFSYTVVILAGVLMIGFLNFLVSFGLAFYVAVRSRGIQLKDYPELIGVVWKYFRQHPFDFLVPPRLARGTDQ
jgi:site-specific recombinase